MADKADIIDIGRDDLDGLVERARAEAWASLIVVGPDTYVPADSGHWPGHWKREARIHRLNAPGGDGLAFRVCKLAGLTTLDLTGNEIGDAGARVISEGLVNLTSLALNNNLIGDTGARAIGEGLVNLTSLDLNNNLIGDVGARAIGEGLVNLRTLFLDDNEIGEAGARAIGEGLVNLTSLDLSSNEIGEAGARAIGEGLVNLTSLDLSSNQIGDAGACAIGEGLVNLMRLDLDDNEIGEVGIRAVLDGRAGGSSLRILRLRGNEGITGLLPDEVVEGADAQAILAAYRSYRDAAKAGTLTRLNELKIHIVGNEAVGKTSLVRFLVDDKPRDPDEKRTPDIVQREKIETRTWGPDESEVRLNIWDFGGQEMMRGTHRFFLTERSLYLLVLEDRRQDDRSVHDWMKMIRNRGRDSPVLIVINKSDDGKDDLRLDEPTLRDTYPNIVGFYRTSCEDQAWSFESIRALRREIVRIAETDPRLKHIRDPIPDTWRAIKDRIAEFARERQVLPQTDFMDLCIHPEDGLDAVDDPDEQRALLQVLHELGVIVAYGLKADDPAVRREIHLLDPNWLTDSVYKIMDGARSRVNDGEFDRADVASWLDVEAYPPERHEFILHLMQGADVGLCFRLPGPDDDRYLLPEALPAERPDISAWAGSNEAPLRFRYRYDYLPTGLMPRFVVAAHRNLAPGGERWRTGVQLEARECRVLVTADVDDRSVDIEVAGPEGLRRAALNVVLDDLEAVHDLNPEAGPVALVPLPDNPEVAVSYETLRLREDQRGADYRHWPDGADHDYEIGELLDGVRRERSRPDNESRQHHDEELAKLVREAAFAGVEAGLTKEPEPAGDTVPHLVVLVHGAGTWVPWQNELKPVLQAEGLAVGLTNYGNVPLSAVPTMPQERLNELAVEVGGQIKALLEEHGVERCSVIAHSLGTYIIAKLLQDGELSFKRLIFCGTVVPEWFEVEKHMDRFEAPLLNEVAQKDAVPSIAGWVRGKSLGSAGRHEFRRPCVEDRIHKHLGHGEVFLTQGFCRRFWVPFLRDGTIAKPDRRPLT